MRLRIIASTLILSCTTCYAEQAIINNYNSAPQPQSQPQNNCNQNNDNSDNNNGTEGMSVVNNGDGSSSNVYSTGTKKPYNVDNSSNCNQQPVIQPYVYPNGGPFPPRPMPRDR